MLQVYAPLMMASAELTKTTHNPKAQVRVLPGSHDLKRPPTENIEPFLSNIRFDSREKLQELMKKGGN